MHAYPIDGEQCNARTCIWIFTCIFTYHNLKNNNNIAMYNVETDCVNFETKLLVLSF